MKRFSWVVGLVFSLTVSAVAANWPQKLEGHVGTLSWNVPEGFILSSSYPRAERLPDWITAGDVGDWRERSPRVVPVFQASSGKRFRLYRLEKKLVIDPYLEGASARGEDAVKLVVYWDARATDGNLRLAYRLGVGKDADARARAGRLTRWPVAALESSTHEIECRIDAGEVPVRFQVWVKGRKRRSTATGVTRLEVWDAPGPEEGEVSDVVWQGSNGQKTVIRGSHLTWDSSRGVYTYDWPLAPGLLKEIEVGGQVCRVAREKTVADPGVVAKIVARCGDAKGTVSGDVRRLRLRLERIVEPWRVWEYGVPVRVRFFGRYGDEVKSDGRATVLAGGAEGAKSAVVEVPIPLGRDVAGFRVNVAPGVWFKLDGDAQPVTVVDVRPPVVTQRFTVRDGLDGRPVENLTVALRFQDEEGAELPAIEKTTDRSGKVRFERYEADRRWAERLTIDVPAGSGYQPGPYRIGYRDRRPEVELVPAMLARDVRAEANTRSESGTVEISHGPYRGNGEPQRVRIEVPGRIPLPSSARKVRFRLLGRLERVFQLEAQPFGTSTRWGAAGVPIVLRMAERCPLEPWEVTVEGVWLDGAGKPRTPKGPFELTFGGSDPSRSSEGPGRWMDGEPPRIVFPEHSTCMGVEAEIRLTGDPSYADLVMSTRPPAVVRLKRRYPGVVVVLDASKPAAECWSSFSAQVAKGLRAVPPAALPHLVVAVARGKEVETVYRRDGGEGGSLDQIDTYLRTHPADTMAFPIPSEAFRYAREQLSSENGGGEILPNRLVYVFVGSPFQDLGSETPPDADPTIEIRGVEINDPTVSWSRAYGKSLVPEGGYQRVDVPEAAAALAGALGVRAGREP